MRVEIYVRANSAVPAVGGVFDDALVVRVREVREHGRATAAAIAAVAEALDVSRHSIVVLRGAFAQKKLLEIQTDHPSVTAAKLAGLRATTSRPG